MARKYGAYADSLRNAVNAPLVPPQEPGTISPSNPPVADPKKPVPVAASVAAPPAGAPQAPPEASALHPVYDAQDGEDPDTGHAHLMQDIGLAIQEMMKQDPETHKSISDMMQQFMGNGVDYDAEAKRLRGLIEARKTPKAPNWLAAGVGSWASPTAAKAFGAQMQAATAGERQKQQDIEDTESQLLKEHVEDLRARGKSKEALLLGLVSNMVGAKKVEMQQQGETDRLGQTLREGTMRIAMQIGSRADIADKEAALRAATSTFEAIMRQSKTDPVSGAHTPLYTPEEALEKALQTLPALKGQTPPAPAAGGNAGVTPPATQKKTTWAEWQAQKNAAKAGAPAAPQKR